MNELTYIYIYIMYRGCMVFCSVYIVYFGTSHKRLRLNANDATHAQAKIAIGSDLAQFQTTHSQRSKQSRSEKAETCWSFGSRVPDSHGRVEFLGQEPRSRQLVHQLPTDSGTGVGEGRVGSGGLSRFESGRALPFCSWAHSMTT